MVREGRCCRVARWGRKGRCRSLMTGLVVVSGMRVGEHWMVCTFVSVLSVFFHAVSYGVSLLACIRKCIVSLGWVVACAIDFSSSGSPLGLVRGSHPVSAHTGG